MILFFFSSRRRHTRSLRDWSSDVCSSDLGALGEIAGPRRERHVETRRAAMEASYGQPVVRSEERRVGKERRSRREGLQVKKKVRHYLRLRLDSVRPRMLHQRVRVTPKSRV